MSRLSRAILPAAGVLLLAGSLIPVYRLLLHPRTGLAGQATADLAASAAAMVWGGTMLALAAGIVASRVAGTRTYSVLLRMRSLVMRPRGRSFAAACALTGAAAALAVARLIFDFEPMLVDATAQLIHARYLADGALTAPLDTIGFFRTQQTVPAAGGWTSQYPPGHVMALAAGTAAGMPWLVGPAMLGIALYFTARAADILLPGRADVRAGMVVAALSPFMLLHAASYMSHTTAAAFIGLALYCVARACAGLVVDGSTAGANDAIRLQWTALAGGAAGVVFATRPLSGLTIGVVMAGAVVLHRNAANRMAAMAALAAGVLPGVLAVMLYNARLFGSPFRFGYDVALGPAAGLGFGVDPWGNTFGLREALSYTSAELTSLSLHIFEAPFPWVAVVGGYLVLSRPAWWEGLLFAAVLLPLAVNLLYWHHGLFMGPRMLNEYGILWCIVIAVACAGVIRILPERLEGRFRLYSPRAFAAGACAAVLMLALPLTAQRLTSLSLDGADTHVLRAAPAGSIVFVHSTWSDRAAMQLAARGWRLDEVETALRQNSTCAVQSVIDGESERASLSLVPGTANRTERVQLPGGSAFRVVAGEAWTPACARQVAADTAGAVDPASFMWRADVRTRQLAVARDLGPEMNRALAGSRPVFALVRSAEGSAELMPYDVAMEKLWPIRKP